MKLNYVIDRFALISGLEGDELSKWTPLCIEAMEEVKLMATEEALCDESCERRLSSLGGVLAYCKYTLYAGENIKSITAGTVSITNFEEARVRAERLWEKEKEALSEYIDASKEFFFKRVSV